MIRYVESPSTIRFDPVFPRVFLAGGITGCPDWQSRMVKLLEETGVDMVVFNPRRENFPIEDPNAARDQIAWEYKHFRMSSCIVFWFSSGTVQPIVMFELGSWSMFDALRPGHVKLVIGVDPSYPRMRDVMIQMELLHPGVVIHFYLEQVARSVAEHAKTYWSCEPYTAWGGLNETGKHDSE